jgi:hypothetical protein
MPHRDLAKRKAYTNQFRGILCYYCNLGLGQFKDSGERLQKAIAYLAKFQPEKR